MIAKRKRFSIANNANIIEKSKHFSAFKAEFAKPLGRSTFTLKTILNQEDVIETKPDTLGNAASPYAELENFS